ncbi:MAG: hypothetical protein UHE93_08080 [Muribaculaceae bacterium]|nr:hypothetical protein [Muribaculaceae bacterium]
MNDNSVSRVIQRISESKYCFRMMALRPRSSSRLKAACGNSSCVIISNQVITQLPP